MVLSSLVGLPESRMLFHVDGAGAGAVSGATPIFGPKFGGECRADTPLRKPQLEVFLPWVSSANVAYEEAIEVWWQRDFLGDARSRWTHCEGPSCGKNAIWPKTKLSYSVNVQACLLPSPRNLQQNVERMDDVEMLTLSIQEHERKQSPLLWRPFVHELRSVYGSQSLA
nr:traB domain-containing protein [Ipomoea batatas]